MASDFCHPDEEQPLPVVSDIMGASLSTSHNPQGAVSVYESHKLDVEILNASRSIPNQITFDDSLEDLCRTLKELRNLRPLDERDMSVVVHRVPPHVVDSLLNHRNPALKVLYSDDERVLIVTLPGKIHSIINAWLILFFGFHHHKHQLKQIATVQNDTYHRPNKGSSSKAGKEPDLLVKRLSGRTGPALIVEVGVSQRFPDLRLAARWWLSNVEGVRVVLLVGYDDVGKKISLEKWTSISVDRGTRSGIVRRAVLDQVMNISWTQGSPTAAPSGFVVAPGSNDPLHIGSVAEILDDITIPPSKDYIILSGEVQELVEHVYQNFLGD